MVSRIGNRVAPEIEQEVLGYSLRFPLKGGAVRVSNELKQQGFQVICGGVRSIWLRHNLQIASLCLKRLEKWFADNEGIFAESQVQALESAKEEKEAHGAVETPHPAFFSVRIPTCGLHQGRRKNLSADCNRHPFQRCFFRVMTAF